MRVNPNILGEANNIGLAPSDANATRGESQPREDLQQIISRSSALSERDAIQVLGNGSEVILRGTVTSDNDLRLAEAMLMLSPQVQTVRNELTVGQ
jgi:osmotically-inducible protein OsmY